ncbi:rRNA maturation RNase YbeY [candidate division KSB1 bacterium]|jgi:rRNA maturation RNase YbeY|nr:MAG: rRNA maturation RNase YbeY [candidate division KSB1 bacterium]
MEIKLHNFPEQLKGDQAQWTELSARIVQAMELNPESVQIIFTDDQTLQQMHARYLNDPSKTDVITFDLGEDGAIEGEIYISIERAEDQAREFGVSPEEEVLRLIIHGLLHLKGYDDLEEEARTIMKAQENKFVDRFRSEL